MNIFKTFRTFSPIPSWFLIATIFILVFLIYSGSLGAGFKWDDHNLIEDNHEIKTWSNTIDIFTKPLHGFSAYYRPLQTLSYKLDYSVWKLNPSGYHLTNILLHFLNTLLLFTLIVLLTKNKRAAWASALLFACHPALAEPVNYISSRSDLLVALFILLASIFYSLREIKNEKAPSLLALFCFILALLSKEIALVFPFVLLIRESCSKKNYLKTFPYFLIALIFLIFRFEVIPFKTTHAFSPSLLLSIPKAFTTYVLALIFPFNPYKTWYIPPVASFQKADFIIPLLGLFLFFFFATKIFQKSRTAWFGLLWFCAYLLPFSTLLYLFCTFQAFPFSYAWIYTPAIGAFLCLSALIPKNFEFKKSSYTILFSIIILSFSFVTLRYNALWKGSEVDFYKHIIKNQTDLGISIIYANMGRSYLDENKLTDALEALNKAIQINPRDLNALSNIAIVYRNQKKYKEALEIFKKVLEIDPKNAKTLFSIGTIHSETGQIEEAINYYKKAIVVNPHISKIHYNIGLLYLKKNNNGLAVKSFQQAATLDPDNADAHYNLAILYAQSGESEKALKEYGIVKRLEPNAFHQTH